MRKLKYLYRLQYRMHDGQWIEASTTGISGLAAHQRLMTRVYAGESDPREEYWRLVPLDFETGQPIKWEDAV